MDQETRDFLDRKFTAIEQKFEEAKRDSDQKFEEAKRHSNQQFEEAKRFFGVVAEDLRSQIQLVAEGVAKVNEKLDCEVSGLREEMRNEFREVKAMIKFSLFRAGSPHVGGRGRSHLVQGPADRLEARLN